MYTNARYEVPMTNGTSVLDLTSTGDKAYWGPVCVPHYIHMVGVVIDATPGDAGVIKGDLRLTRDSDTNRTDGTVFTIALATSHTVTAGSVSKVIYHKLTTPFLVVPGQEVVVEVTDASASVDEAKISFWVEAVWQDPDNIPQEAATMTMVATA